MVTPPPIIRSDKPFSVEVTEGSKDARARTGSVNSKKFYETHHAPIPEDDFLSTHQSTNSNSQINPESNFQKIQETEISHDTFSDPALSNNQSSTLMIDDRQPSETHCHLSNDNQSINEDLYLPQGSKSTTGDQATTSEHQQVLDTPNVTLKVLETHQTDVLPSQTNNLNMKDQEFNSRLDAIKNAVKSIHNKLNDLD